MLFFYLLPLSKVYECSKKKKKLLYLMNFRLGIILSFSLSLSLSLSFNRHFFCPRLLYTGIQHFIRYTLGNWRFLCQKLTSWLTFSLVFLWHDIIHKRKGSKKHFSNEGERERDMLRAKNSIAINFTLLLLPNFFLPSTNWQETRVNGGYYCSGVQSVLSAL